MFERSKYKDVNPSELVITPDLVAAKKYDGGNYFVPVASDGSLSFISRRESVKGGFPDKTDRVPHLAKTKLPQYAGHVYNVELIHTGWMKQSPESHRQVSGILNSLPERAIATQAALGPVRAVIHNVINPQFTTFSEKIEHLKDVEKALATPDTFFAIEPHYGEDIRKLIESTKREGREGVIITSRTQNETNNPRLKIKHKTHHNLRITKILQEFDKDGKPKDSMGAVEVSDATGAVVGQVGTGWSRSQRIEAWRHPKDYLDRLIQVESLGMAVNALRMPVYNGDADGNIDRAVA